MNVCVEQKGAAVKTLSLFGLLLIMPTQASAQGLTVGGSCPGVVTYDISGTPGGRAVLMGGAGMGSDVVGLGRCAGAVTGLSGLTLRGVTLLDGAGQGYRSSVVPAMACGRPLQVLDLQSCDLSSVQTIPEPVTCLDSYADIYTQADVADYVGCTDLDGVYVHASAGVVDVDFPNLETVSGDVYFYQAPDLARVSMPMLEQVDGNVYLDGNTALVEADLGSLQAVGGYFYMTNNTALPELRVSSLSSVGQYSYITGNTSLCLDPAIDWAAISYDYAYVTDPVCVT